MTDRHLSNRISIAQLLTLDATPSNLDGKTVVLVNDSGTERRAANWSQRQHVDVGKQTPLLTRSVTGRTFADRGPDCSSQTSSWIRSARV